MTWLEFGGKCDFADAPQLCSFEHRGRLIQIPKELLSRVKSGDTVRYETKDGCTAKWFLNGVEQPDITIGNTSTSEVVPP